jgi:hypothetical protein
LIQKLRTVLLVVIVSLLAAAPGAVAETGVIHARFSSGINATIYTADYLTQRVTAVSASRGLIVVDGSSGIGVITDIGDELIHNKGDGAFHSYDVRDVIEALREVDLPGLTLDVEIMVLPFPREDVLVSSANGDRIFLSPQVVEVTRENAAYVVTHEVGHVFQERYLPGLNGTRGANYRHLRGIEDDTRFHAYAVHMDRPSEIFAEDFRVLWGGQLAYFDGRIENADLTPPAAVPGLEAFFRSLVATPGAGAIVGLASYPNPFNPSTELTVTLDPDLVGSGPIAIRIYDVRGGLVRELMTADATSSEIRVRWDGLDQRGQRVASAMYFGVVDFAGERRTQKLLLVK